MLLLRRPFNNLWPKTTIDIRQIVTTTGTEERSTLYTGLVAARSQKEIKVVSGPFNEVGSQIVDVFYVSQDNSGDLPAVTEDHFVRLDSLDRRILSATDQGGQGETLEILAERVR